MVAVAVDFLNKLENPSKENTQSSLILKAIILLYSSEPSYIVKVKFRKVEEFNGSEQFLIWGTLGKEGKLNHSNTGNVAKSGRSHDA